jgi:hypothetical protein
MYKKLKDDYSRLETEFNRYLELLNPPVEDDGDDDDVFAIDPPNVEASRKVAQELSVVGDELAKAKAQTKKAEKELEETKKKIAQELFV